MKENLIEEARQYANLRMEDFAALAQIEPERMKLLCEDAARASGRELGRVARGLGLEVGDFLKGHYGVMGMFFRAFDTDLELDALMLETDGPIYGDFCRCVKRINELRRLLEAPLPDSSWRAHAFRVDPEQAPWQQGHALALEARAFFGLGDVPIPSMRRFLKTQGVEVLFLQPDRLQARVDGACISQPSPAVLVNPIYEAAPWRARATMAHEFCHLLVDMETARGFAISPSGTERRKRGQKWELFESYPRMEKRANAFAAAFLAPQTAIEALLSEHGFLDNPVEGIGIASGYFGVSNEIIVNQLASRYRWSNEWRMDVLERANRQFSDSFSYDEFPEERGLFTGELQTLTLEALDRGLISPIEARQYLDIPLTQALPKGRGAPMVSTQNQAIKHAYKLLPESHMSDGHYPLSATWTEEGWLVELEGTPANLLLAHDFSTAREV